MAETVDYSVKSAGKKLLQLINLERKEVGYIYFFAALIGLIQLSLPLGIQAIVGLLFGRVLSASLIILIIFIVGGVLFSGIVQLMQMRVTERIQQRIFARLTFAYAYRIPKIDLLSVDNYYLPELVNRFFDTASLQKGLSKLLRDFPGATLQIIFGLILLSFYHPVFIVFGVILLAVVFLIFYLSGPSGFRTSMAESDYKYKVGHWLEEISRAIKTFKFSQQHELHLTRTDQLTAGYLESRTKHFDILAFQYKVLIAFKVIITAIMLVMGTLLIINQQINLGQFIAAEIIIIVILNSVEKLIRSLETVYDVLTSIEKLDKVLQKPHDVEIKDLSVSPITLHEALALTLVDLSFSYTGKKAAIKQLNLNVKPGEKICLTGAEGSGKTTLLRVLSGMYASYEGQILVNGVPLKHIPETVWRSKVAVCLAQEELFSGSLLENLTLGDQRISLNEVAEVCHLVGLSTFIQKQEQGYHTILDPQGQKLSYNVVQKILLGRCFLYKPSLLLLENGWQGLEADCKKRIIEKLISDKSFSLIAVSDEPLMQRQCDQVVTLHKGLIA